MYETTYPIDTAAEMLGCQQKKIMAEWAKGTIQIVLDFGSQESITRGSYEKYDPRSYSAITPWNIADISAPAISEYFPDELLYPREIEGLRIYESDPERFKVWPDIFHEYSQSGFYFDSKHSKAEKQESKPETMCVINVLLYGFWAVPYSEFSRIHVQDSFTLHPCSKKPIVTAVTAIFTPGNGSRRINAPEKKNLRITESGMKVMRKLLADRPGHQQTQSPVSEIEEQPKAHGGIVRFALEREKILAAALYVAHHYPKDTGKTFKSHAECIDKHSYLFWKDEPAPDPERVAKILSDATRAPSEWKILGGNAKQKKIGDYWHFKAI